MKPKLDRLPVYYQQLKIVDVEELKKQRRKIHEGSEYHHTKELSPRIFYKAISKTVAFGLNERYDEK